MVELNGWKIYPLVCFDLRFPVWSRNNKNDTYDLLYAFANCGLNEEIMPGSSC